MSILLLLAGCGSSDDPEPGLGTGGFGGGGAGGVPVSSGGTPTGTGSGPAASGGTPTGSGGIPTGSGGIPTGSGGIPTGSGGAQPGSGGAQQGSGGAQQGSGGAQQGSGGAQQGSGGAQQGSGGAAATGGPCLTDMATESAIMGDSYITGSFSPALQPALVALDPSLSKTPNTGVAGVSMASGGLSPASNVPSQLTTVLSRFPKVKFLIFDGGGNDGILCDTAQFPRCDTICLQAGSSQQQVCKDITAKADAAFKGMLTKAAEAGVKDAIYFYYPHTPMKNGGANEFLDYAVPFAKATCDGANAATGGKLNCWFLPLVEPFKTAFGDAAKSQFETFLGVHPLAPGVNLMAKEIFNTMKAHCVGFTAADATKYGCTCKP